jgi:hypothetical protein
VNVCSLDRGTYQPPELGACHGIVLALQGAAQHSHFCCNVHCHLPSYVSCVWFDVALKQLLHYITRLNGRGKADDDSVVDALNHAGQ